VHGALDLFTGPRACGRRWLPRPRRLLALCLKVAFFFGSGLPLTARAHDLAIDQLVLWPDPEHARLRGEITFDPELTREKGVLPTLEHHARVLEFLSAQLRIEGDGQPLALAYQVRELWVQGGATRGDLVVFTGVLPHATRELRVFAGNAFSALVVSIQVPDSQARSRASSWLLDRGSWTPGYRLDSTEPASGWRAGGPEVFASLQKEPPTLASNDTPAEPGTAAARASPDAVSLMDRARLGVRFVKLGFQHILPDGVDHMLFVIGLVLGAPRRFRYVLLSLTLFTLAHTVTLALGNLTTWRVPADWVEPLIALSICCVGVGNLLPARKPEAGARYFRHALVFGFGLIHGMGFANALTDMAFEPRYLWLTLFSFNLGVELGQLAVVALLLAALHGIRSPRHLQSYVIFPGSAAIALIGLLFVIERLLTAG
jgi:HupE/UreJ protein